MAAELEKDETAAESLQLAICTRVREREREVGGGGGVEGLNDLHHPCKAGILSSTDHCFPIVKEFLPAQKHKERHVVKNVVMSKLQSTKLQRFSSMALA